MAKSSKPAASDNKALTAQTAKTETLARVEKAKTFSDLCEVFHGMSASAATAALTVLAKQNRTSWVGTAALISEHYMAGENATKKETGAKIASAMAVFGYGETYIRKYYKAIKYLKADQKAGTLDFDKLPYSMDKYVKDHEPAKKLPKITITDIECEYKGTFAGKSFRIYHGIKHTPKANGEDNAVKMLFKAFADIRGDIEVTYASSADKPDVQTAQYMCDVAVVDAMSNEKIEKQSIALQPLTGF